MKPVAYVEGCHRGLTVRAGSHTDALAAVAAALAATPWARHGSMDGLYVEIVQPVKPGERPSLGGAALRERAGDHARIAADAAKASLRAAGYIVRGRVTR